jgi:hypothetical protein
MRLSRRSIVLSSLPAACALLGARTSRAELVSVPIELQAELLAKVLVYDRNMPARAGDRAQVLVLESGSDGESGRFASRMQAALHLLPQIGGFSHDERIVEYSGATDLAQQCRAQRAAILIVSPGLGDQIAAISDALDGIALLTVAAVPDYVQKGLVLGFDVISGKPKLLVHLGHARKQHVDLRAEVLKLMMVYE